MIDGPPQLFLIIYEFCKNFLPSSNLQLKKRIKHSTFKRLINPMAHYNAFDDQAMENKNR